MVGTYSVEFTALNNQNLYSNAYPVNMSVINSSNHHPIISNLIIYPRDFTIGVPSESCFFG